MDDSLVTRLPISEDLSKAVAQAMICNNFNALAFSLMRPSIWPQPVLWRVSVDISNTVAKLLDADHHDTV